MERRDIISKPKFAELDTQGKVEWIMERRTPKPEQVLYEPTIEFLDPEGELTREERGRVIAMGDRTAISYRNLAKQVIEDRDRKVVEIDGEEVDATSAFYLMYSLAARSSKEIAHTSILEQVNVGPDEFGGDPPIVLEGISVLTALRDVCRERHFGFEAFSSRGGIFPEGYCRIPEELKNTRIGEGLEAINGENYHTYLELTRKGIGHYLQATERKEGEKLWEWQWRVLNLALDDSRQVTNGTYLNHLSMHPNSALSLREALVRLSSAELPETRKIAERLRELTSAGLPTLMKYTEASPYTSSLAQRRKEIIKNLKIEPMDSLRGQIRESTFLDATVTPYAHRIFLAAFLAKEQGVSFPHVMTYLYGVSETEIKNSIEEIFEGIQLHDKPPEELEMIQVTANYEMSVGAIYELIRHRLATHIVSGFTPNRGYTIPEVYYHLGVDDIYCKAIENNERQYDLVSSLGPDYERVFGPYFVTRAHLQPVTVRMSGTDLFHFIKIRAHGAAHPDISLPALGVEKFLRETEPLVFSHLVKK